MNRSFVAEHFIQLLADRFEEDLSAPEPGRHCREEHCTVPVRGRRERCALHDLARIRVLQTRSRKRIARTTPPT